MAEKTVTLQNKETLMEVFRREKDPEVKRKLSFISLVAAWMEAREAAIHFGTALPPVISPSLDD